MFSKTTSLRFLPFLLVMLSFVSFGNRSLLGTWVMYSYHQGMVTYRVKSGFSGTDSGFEFKPKGKLKVRQRDSWCGTERVRMEVVRGKWVRENDSVIILKYPKWGQNLTQKMLIRKINKDSMTVEFIYK